MPENKSNNPSNSTSKYVLKTANFEGFEPSVYKDTKGKKTIGYGFNLDDKYVQNYLKNIGYNVNKLISGKVSLNESESKTILSDLYNKSYQAASKIVKNFKELPEEVQHTLADLNYNLGTTKLRGFKRMLSALEKRDYKTAAEELKNSDYYTQTGRRAKAHYEKLKTITDPQKKVEAPAKDLSTLDFLKSAYVGIAPASPFLPNYTTLLKIKESLPFFQAAPESKVQPEEETYAQGGLIKRADGSYSRRGLWDNIRANKGSGRKPTAEMLRQERKIRAAEKKEDGGPVYNWIPPIYPRVGARNEHGGWLDEYEYGGSIEDQRIPTPAQYEFGLKYAANNTPMMTANQMGTRRSTLPDGKIVDSSPEIPAYAHGATVWNKRLADKQISAAYVVGPDTNGTQVKNTYPDRMSGAENPTNYRIGDVVPTGMDYKSPAAGTYDYNKDIQPYHTMRLHAPDTTQIAKNGGRVTEKYKKRVGIPYAISPGVSNAGMYVGPTTQRGITFGNGGPIPASRQDSISLLNSVNALNKYYQTSGFHEPQPYVFSPSYFNTQAGRASLNQEEEENIRQYNYMLKDFETSGKNSKLYKDYKQRDPSMTPEKYTQLIKGAITQTKDNNPYKRYYRDLYPSKIDIEAPAAIIDTRIQPQALMEYRAAAVPSSEKAKRFLKNSSTQYYQSELSEGPAGMASAFYYYDPIAITPWDILTESQKKERVKKYGVTGTPLPSIKKSEKSKPKPETLQFMPMRGMTSIPMEQLMPQKTSVPYTNPLPTQYMDTRGEWSDKPQVPPVYTEEQLLKMGYRAPKKKNGGWLDNL